MRGRREPRGRVAARELQRRHDVRLGVARVLRGEDRGQLFVVDLRAARGEPRVSCDVATTMNIGWPTNCTTPSASTGRRG
jgi:hypothetical protein